MQRYLCHILNQAALSLPVSSFHNTYFKQLSTISSIFYHSHLSICRFSVSQLVGFETLQIWEKDKIGAPETFSVHIFFFLVKTATNSSVFYHTPGQLRGQTKKGEGLFIDQCRKPRLHVRLMSSYERGRCHDVTAAH